MAEPEEPTRSLVGLSEAPRPATTTVAHPFAIDDDRRYRELSVVGAGGLGTVLLARDARLDRDVALKRIGPGIDQDAAGARFLREARITARLDHPGIVPVHDAGLSADGRLYYTMRLIRGQSLADLARAATDGAARLDLVAALTAACHAVGYAHRHGILHRDLKPANLMIGEFGETQVVDWGLAAELDEAQAAPEVVIGTLPYLAPEAVRGAGGTIAVDVWALGAVLYEVVTGQRRVPGERDQVLAALRSGRVPSPAWPDEVPVELRAIIGKALALAPGDRYRDAEALAADLEAFRDGRRVAAHRYSTWALARRLVVAWRWPLALIAAALVAGVTALAVTAHRIDRQRARAVAAEAATGRELDRAEAALGWALASSAVSALEAGYQAQAELLAAHALTHGELPDARGVLAATAAAAHPRSVERIAVPGCPWVAPGLLCVRPDAVEQWTASPLARTWRVDGPIDGAIALAAVVVTWSPTGEVIVLDGATGTVRWRRAGLGPIVRAVADVTSARVALHDGRDAIVATAAAAPRLVARPCGDGPIEVIATSAARLWVMCGGALRWIDDGDQRGPLDSTYFGVVRPRATALSVTDGDHQVAIGGAGGDVMLIDRRDCLARDCRKADRELLPPVTRHAIRDVVVTGATALVIADGGDAFVVGRDISAPILRLPLADAGAARATARGLEVGGRELRVWSLAHDGAPRQLAGALDLVALAWSPDGGDVALGGGADIVIRAVSDGHARQSLKVRGTIHALAWSPDGRRLAAAITDDFLPGVRWFNLASLHGPTPLQRELPLAGPPRVARHVVFEADGRLRAVHADGTARWSADGAVTEVAGPSGRAVSAEGAWLVDADRRRWRWTGTAWAAAGDAIGAVAIAASADGRWVATAGPRVVALDDLRGGGRRALAPEDGDVVALALAPDGRWLAIGTSTGEIELRGVTDGVVRARLRGHHHRVTSVQFVAGDLISTSGDGTLLRFRLDAVTAAPAALVAAATARWQLTLADVAPPAEVPSSR